MQLGDTLTEGEALQYTGLPFFAPELFQAVELANPMKSKQLQAGLMQLGEEGAIQVFRPHEGGAMLLGAVGPLQFEVVQHRLKAEAVGVVPIILQRLALVGKHGCALRHQCGGGMVLGAEDVARGPANAGSQGLQRLDQHGRLDRHVQAAGDARAAQGLTGREFLANGHQAGHLGLGDPNFLAPPVGERQVGDDVLVGRQGGLEDSVHAFLLEEKPLCTGRERRKPTRQDTCG